AVALLAATMLLGACHKKKPEVVAPPPTTNPTQPARDTASENARAREAARQDSIARSNQARSAATEAARNSLSEMVFFEYDQAEIRSDMQDVLNRKVAILRANPGLTLRIEGHADERGTVEYNLALSLRRANTVRDYLTGFGIDASRLEVTGFGEERPLDPAQTEDAFAKNRRAEFQVTRGGDNLVPGR
ncbi:MAG TPA: OmpA family protein, partial [Longimicrobiales bacterium]|nr:OmpA family protein [Longimicrobiales bacterium]